MIQQLNRMDWQNQCIWCKQSQVHAQCSLQTEWLYKACYKQTDLLPLGSFVQASACSWWISMCLSSFLTV